MGKIEPGTDSDMRLCGSRQVISNMGKLRDVGGARCIPRIQIVLALAANLDQADACDKATLFSLLGKSVEELGGGSDHNKDADAKEIANRLEGRESQLVIMRLLSVLDITNSDMKQESRPMSNCLKIHATVK